jgi:hypothetical protein
MESKEVIHFELSDESVEELKKISLSKGMTMSECFVEALKEYNTLLRKIEEFKDYNPGKKFKIVYELIPEVCNDKSS